MKTLILGASGMLGHQLWRHLHARHETWVTLRRPAAEFAPWGLFNDGRVLDDVDAMDFASVARAVRELRPECVLNGIGIVKQLPEGKEAIPSLILNALLPHRLAEVCGEVGARLVLFSTDCVFSGKRGQYTETDIADAEDLYGRTKLLGEISDQPHVLTLRSSIIGRELGSVHGLIDWFLSQRGGRVRGFRRAIYSGFTTLEMARIIENVAILSHGLSGLWQVASEPINKLELLRLVREKFRVEVEIDPFEGFVCDRSLEAGRFNAATGYRPPDWNSMIEEMAALPTP